MQLSLRVRAGRKESFSRERSRLGALLREKKVIDFIPVKQEAKEGGKKKMEEKKTWLRNYEKERRQREREASGKRGRKWKLRWHFPVKVFSKREKMSTMALLLAIKRNEKSL